MTIVLAALGAYIALTLTALIYLVRRSNRERRLVNAYLAGYSEGYRAKRGLVDPEHRAAQLRNAHLQ